MIIGIISVLCFVNSTYMYIFLSLNYKKNHSQSDFKHYYYAGQLFKRKTLIDLENSLIFFV